MGFKEGLNLYFKAFFILNQNDYITKWFMSTNHRIIGTLYFILGIIAGIIVTTYFIIIRLEFSSSDFYILKIIAAIMPTAHFINMNLQLGLQYVFKLFFSHLLFIKHLKKIK